MTTNDRPDDDALANGQRSEPTREPTANVLLTDDGAFAVLPDGTRVRLANAAADAVSHSILCDARHGHAASAPHHDAGSEFGPQYMRASMAQERDPLTGQFKYVLSAEELERGRLGKVSAYESQQKAEIVRCLKRRGSSERYALVRAMEYVFCLRRMKGLRGLRGDASVRTADAGLAASARMSEILRECGHDKLRARSQDVTDNPLDAFIDADPVAA